MAAARASLKLSYVIPSPSTPAAWAAFDGDLACLTETGYDAVELQIADPAEFDEARIRGSLDRAGLPLSAFQTGSTYATRGNCLCTANPLVRSRTVSLLRSFVDLAVRWKSVIVFGSLQGRLSDEPDVSTGRVRIVEALREVSRYATDAGATLAIEPVNHMEVGWHNTIAEVSDVVRAIGLRSARMMIDTFHMNIEEREMISPIRGISDILAHVHLSETNRDVLGTGHWDTRAFFAALESIGYRGYCAVGVYNTRLSRRECMAACMRAIRDSQEKQDG
jgi:sugar phosphate isomerase/epimerase